jgi:outer membrane protein assembly factor BamA
MRSTNALHRHLVVATLLVLPGSDVCAQSTRAEEIDQARRDKQARLWPERESPLVAQANELVERGFREGIADGRGASGPQFVLGGMRSGQGMSVGIGWRQTDFWQERLGFRTTARGSWHGAYMFDGRLDFHPLTTRRSFANLYAKYENSPRMDFYGRGPASQEGNRSSFLSRDFAVDFQAGVDLTTRLRAGVTGGWVHVRTGPGNRSGVPSTEEKFAPDEAPGIAEGPVKSDRWGAFVAFDYRDSRTGPRRGGVYGVQVRQFFDRTLDRFSFPQGEFEFQQYLPYFNGTRVIALRAAMVLSWNDEDQDVPVYFMPSVGGTDSVRGFARDRFRDNHSLVMSAEHRWYVFRGLDMAIFADAGKVVPRKAQIDLGNLEVASGIGFRTRIRNTVIMRTDFAMSREGFQVIWTFSDVFRMGD